jgi:hypothetical protein
MQVTLSRRCIAEFFGTFWLVFGGCGAAVLAAAFPQLGIGFAGVALAFGLTVLTMAYAIGHISGCHLNPAVTLGLVAGKRFPAKEIVPYWAAQVLGAIAAAWTLYAIASGKDGYAIGGFASNGYALHSPGGYSLIACSGCGGPADVLLPGRDSGCDRPESRQGLRSAGHWSVPDAYPPDWDSGDQPVGESGALHRSRAVGLVRRQQLGAASALALLAGAARRRDPRWCVLCSGTRRA